MGIVDLHRKLASHRLHLQHSFWRSQGRGERAVVAKLMKSTDSHLQHLEAHYPYLKGGRLNPHREY